MIDEINKLAKEFLTLSKDKPIRIISHHDTDGITSAAIIAKTLKRLDKKFSIKILKNLEGKTIKQELKKPGILLFTDLASNSLEHFKETSTPIFILDHHQIDKDKLTDNIRIINPHLFNEEEISGSGICYLFSKAISEKNKDLANLAVIGMIGDRLDKNISKIAQQIINEAQDLEIKKGLQIFSATRPLKRSLEYSSSTYIPGVTGSSIGVLELLREVNIPPEKTLCELTKDENQRLVTAIMVRRAKQRESDEIIGNIYLLKFFNRKEDVRELSTQINACSRLGHPDIALAYCLENSKAKTQAENIYVKYKQQLVSALSLIEKIPKVKGNGFVILNAKEKIKDTIIGTVTSILSSSMNYEEGTILIGMAYDKDKIKVSARIVGKAEKNLKEILEKSLVEFEAEVGGHQAAAGCLLKKEDEEKFINILKKNLEIEVVKI